MSLRSFKVFLIYPLCALVWCGLALAEDWMAGAVVVQSIEGEVALEEVGAESVRVEIAELPLYCSGLLRVHTQANSAVFLRTSNQISIYNAGPGFFAIERFEQVVAERGELQSTAVESGQSRMILNLRDGLLVMDSRDLSETSQLIVETPLGRISVKNGWWMMRIADDVRSQIYSYSIECADGILRFTDRKGATYTLGAGQRLSGAGSSARPSIEVAEMTAEGRETFQDFSALAASLETEEHTWAAFQEEMKSMANLTKQVGPALTETRASQTDKRPVVIEYAPRPSPVTEFRAIIRPPSQYEADLF